MKAFTRIILPVLIGSFVLAGCQVDWDDLMGKDEKNVIRAKNLPVNGAQEVPPRATPAEGRMDVKYNKKTKVLTYTVTWAGLTGNPIGAHIHGEAPRGANAGIKHDFTAPLPKTTSGTYTGSVTEDEVAIKEAGLLQGLYYVNIHTPMFPGGEIRGQIEF